MNRLLTTVAIFFSTVFLLKASIIESTVTGGPWNQPSSWVGGIVPSSTDDVIIQGLIISPLFGVLEVNALQLMGGGTLEAGSQSSKLKIQTSLDLESGAILTGFLSLEVYGITTNNGHMNPAPNSGFIFYGNLINYGLVTGAEDQGGNKSRVYVYGTLENMGIWENIRNWLGGNIVQSGTWPISHITRFTGSTIQHLCWQDTIQGGEFLVEDDSLIIEVECDLVVNNAYVDLNEATLDMNNYALTVISNRVENGAIINVEHLYFYEPNASHIDRVVVSGNHLRIHGHLRTQGIISWFPIDTMHVEGKISAAGNGSIIMNFHGLTVIYPDGAFYNNGSTAQVDVYLYGTLINNGIWNVGTTKAYRDVVNNNDFQSALYLNGNNIQGIRGTFEGIQSNNTRNKIKILEEDFSSVPGTLTSTSLLHLYGDTLDAQHGDLFFEGQGDVGFGGVFEQTDTIFIEETADPFLRSLIFLDTVFFDGKWKGRDIVAHNYFSVNDTTTLLENNYFYGTFINEGYVRGQGTGSSLHLRGDTYNFGYWGDNIICYIDGAADQNVYLENSNAINATVFLLSLLPNGVYQWEKNTSLLLSQNNSSISFAGTLTPNHAGVYQCFSPDGASRLILISALDQEECLHDTLISQQEEILNPITAYPLDNHVMDVGPNNLEGAWKLSVQAATDRFGNACGALYFDGTDQAEVRIASNPLLQQPELSVSVWVKPTSLTQSNFARIVDNYQNNNKTGYTLTFDNLQQKYVCYFWTTDGQLQSLVIPDSIDIDNWHHILISISQSEASIYYDGKQKGHINLDAPLQPSNRYLSFGNGFDDVVAYPFHGSIDEVLIFSGTLTCEEINDLAEAQQTDDFIDIDTMHYAYHVIDTLRALGIITGDGNTNFCTVRPDSLINRAELASPIYRSLGLWEFSFMDSIPTPFNDIQQQIWYDTLVRKLSFLEYGDGIAPFNREQFNFNPSGYITKAHALKVLLEAWDIAPNASLGTSFTDVSPSHDAYGYITKAEELGLIQAFDSLYCGTTTFCPNDYITRAQAFALLYQLIQTQAQPYIQDTDFFYYPNITPINLAAAKNGHSGNFDFHTKTSFVISDIGVPIVFGHTYNSYLADLPKAFFRVNTTNDSLIHFYLQPIGKGWSHRYHSYLLEIKAEDPFYDGLALDRWVHVLPDGSIHVYKETDNGYAPETKGVYHKLTKNGDFWEVKTKEQITYRYSQPDGVSATCPYLLHSITDRNNNTVDLIYEDSYQSGFKRLAQVDAAADGRDLFFFYHPGSDLLERVEDPLGRKIFFAYDDLEVDGQNRLQTFTDAKNQSTQYTYGNEPGTNHLLMEIELPKGNKISNGYTANRQLNSFISGDEINTYSYGRSIGPNGVIIDTLIVESSSYGLTKAIFNDDAMPTAIQTPQQDNITIDYLPEGILPAAIDINNKHGEYDWDERGNLLKADLPEGVSHRFTYTPFNDIEVYTNPRSEIWSYGYNGNGNLISAMTPRGTTTYNVNGVGQTTQVTTPAGVVIDYEYGNGVDLTQTSIAAEGITSNYTYDGIGRLLTYTNPNGIATTYTYDENDNITSEHFVHTTSYSYNANDMLSQVINAKGNATTLEYDFERDFLISSTFGDFSDTYEYLADGRPSIHTDPNGNQFIHHYDDQMRLQQIESPNDLVEYGYDDWNRIISITNNTGTISFEYDSLDRVIRTTDFWNNEVIYEYDEASNITKITYPDGKAVTYTYSDDNLMESVTDWNDQLTTYSYRDDGALSSINYPNGTSAHYQYDQAARVIGLHWLQANDIDTICSYHFTLDPMGQHITEQRNEPLGIPNLDDLLVNSTYNDVNRIENAGSTNFIFEPRGTAQIKGSTAYGFDDYERLTGINGGSVFYYDGLGHRRSASRSGQTTRYVLDVVGLSQVLMETDVNGTPINYYVYGLGLVSRIKPDNATRYYHYDYRGSTIAMTDEEGGTTHQYSYGPFGESWQVVEEDFNPYRYVGQYGIQYEDDDLYFMRARYYDAEIGRFLSEDPVWHANLYPYAGNNPVMMIDPKGNVAHWIVGGTVGGIAQLIYSSPEIGKSIYDGFQGIKYGIQGDYDKGNYYLERATNRNIEVIGDISEAAVEGAAFGWISGKIRASTLATKVFGKTGMLKIIDMRTREGILLKQIWAELENKVGDFTKDEIIEFFKEKFILSDDEINDLEEAIKID
jgi:RHS repeat-associated protein